MRVITKKFVLTRQRFFIITLKEFVLREWWGYFLLAPLMLVYAIATKVTLSLILIFVGICLLSLVVLPYLYIRFKIMKVQSGAFFQPMTCEITPNFADFITEDGRMERVNLKLITRVARTGDFFLLFEDKHFYYIPTSAFYSERDLEMAAKVLR